jgi:chemotaxis protein CheX
MDTDELTQRIPPDVVADLVSTAWQTFVGETDMIPVEATSPAPGANVLCSSIAIGGPWSATLLLHCTSNLARVATATVLGMELDELDPADVRDIIGELANIVGGNVKGFVSDADSEWTLSLPVVSEGIQSVPGSRLATEISFLCQGELIGCQIREHA